MLKQIGMNVDFQSLDWGTVVQRRASKEPIDKGGWNIFYTYLGGFGNITPAPTWRSAAGGNGLVRLAERPEDGGAARRLVRRARSRGPAEDLRRNAGRVLEESVLRATGMYDRRPRSTAI